MWLVIWLAGEAAMVMNAISPEVCQDIMLPMVVADIESGVRQDPDGTLWVEGEDGERLSWYEWDVTCEDTQIELGAKQNG